jgi:hypothetical protein
VGAPRGIYFRRLLVGYFEATDFERGCDVMMKLRKVAEAPPE